MEPIPQEKIQASVAHCMQSKRLSAFWAQAPENARPYILLRFYAATFPDEMTADEYEARRDDAASHLSPDDVQFLLQHERETTEVKYLISLRNRTPSSPPSSLGGTRSHASSSPTSSLPSGVRSRASSSIALYVFLGALCLLAAAAAVRFFVRRPSAPERQDQGAPNEVRPFADAPSVQPAEKRPPPPQSRPQPQPQPQQQPQPSPHAAADAPSTAPTQSEENKPANVDVEAPVVKQPESAPSDKESAPAQPVPEESPAADEPAPGKTLQSLGGIRFGSPHPGVVIASELLFPGDSIAACGLGRAVKGPVLKRTFLSFSSQPVLWTSAKTFSVYRMEFTWEGEQKPEEAMAEVVSALESRFAAKSEALPAGGGRVMRTGETVMTVCISDGPADGGQASRATRHVQMCVEHVGAKNAAKAEFDELRREMTSDFDASSLFAAGYPNGGMASKGKSASKKANAPKAFCGVVFGSLPTPGTRVVVVPRTGVHAFPLDYAGRAPGAFKGFSRGMAEFTYDRGVHAVELHCIQQPDELTKEEWTDNVRETLARRFASSSAADAENAQANRSLPAVFKSGTLEVTLAEDPQGGLLLRAVDKSISAP